jgi:hypothetical protein
MKRNIAIYMEASASLLQVPKNFTPALTCETLVQPVLLGTDKIDAAVPSAKLVGVGYINGSDCVSEVGIVV